MSDRFRTGAGAGPSSGFATRAGAILGTPQYIPPEVLKGKPFTPAADQYALACVAGRDADRQVPFQGKTPFEIQTGHVHQPPPDVRQLNPELPASIWLLCKRL